MCGISPRFRAPTIQRFGHAEREALCANHGAGRHPKMPPPSRSVERHPSKLLKLSIERHTYGDKKGIVFRRGHFHRGDGKVTLHLNEQSYRANASCRTGSSNPPGLPPACLCKRRWRAREVCKSSASLRPPPCKTLPHACRSPCHEEPAATLTRQAPAHFLWENKSPLTNPTSPHRGFFFGSSTFPH